jgi:hypothetical protein
LSASSFGSVEADQADIGLLLKDADRVAVDHADIVGIDWGCAGNVRPKKGNRNRKS